jgi:hypothetical protein
MSSLLLLIYTFINTSFAVSPTVSYPFTYLDMLALRTEIYITKKTEKPRRAHEFFLSVSKPKTIIVDIRYNGVLTQQDSLKLQEFYRTIILEEAKDLSVTGVDVKFDIAEHETI